MYCNQCGYNVGNANFCPSCGSSQQQTQNVNVGQPVNQGNQSNQGTSIGTYFDNAQDIKPQNEGGGLINIFWGFLSLIPIVGFVLYFTWRTKFPKRAKICLWCGIFGFIINYYVLSNTEDACFKLIEFLVKF